MLDRLKLAPHVMAPADPAEAAAILRAALADHAVAAGAVTGGWLVGVALAAPAGVAGVDRLLALGVAPRWRRAGVATALLRALRHEPGRGRAALVALHTAAERDPFDPLPRAVRRGVAEELARRTGMSEIALPERISTVDPDARLFVAVPPSAPDGMRERLAEWLTTL